MAVQRLCRAAAKLTTTHDAQLIWLYAYLDTTGPIALSAELSPEDLDDVQFVMWSDADWAGDPEDSKSTSGLLLELLSPNNGHRWPISWSVKRQGSTSNLTAESETVAICNAATKSRASVSPPIALICAFRYCPAVTFVSTRGFVYAMY